MKTYVARQPIFGRNFSVYGYELLYRDSETNAYNPNMDGNKATRNLISNVMTTFDVGTLCDSKYVFINFTEELLRSKIPYLLAANRTVIEILETVKVTSELIAILKKLKEKGFMLAMDDYVDNPDFDDVIEIVDIIKVDFRQIKDDSKYKLPNKAKFKDKIMLAEKIETKEEFERAKKGNYAYFQGYYFMKPIVFSKREMDISPVTYSRMLEELQNTHLDFNRLATIIKSDATATYKLLYRANTLRFFRKYRIRSVKQALTQMGMKEVYRWVMLLLIRDCGKNSPDEMLKTALVRGLFCEDMADKLKLQSQMQEEAFMTGMFSMFNILAGKDFATMLEEMGVSIAVESALQGEKNTYKEILDFAVLYETADWDKVGAFIEENHLDEEQVFESYTNAVKYADVTFDISVKRI